ncbi:hypothetical protein H4R35_005819, partial [Dimargaris xerosporica]
GTSAYATSGFSIWVTAAVTTALPSATTSTAIASSPQYSARPKPRIQERTQCPTIRQATSKQYPVTTTSSSVASKATRRITPIPSTGYPSLPTTTSVGRAKAITWPYSPAQHIAPTGVPTPATEPKRTPATAAISQCQPQPNAR